MCRPAALAAPLGLWKTQGNRQFGRRPVAEIGLSEVVRALRAELDEAMAAAEGERIQFQANAIELEFQIGVTKSVDGHGGIRFWVLELGGGASLARESIQRVKLSLTPVTAEGGGVKIARPSDESPLAE
jgi:hypothetical protein